MQPPSEKRGSALTHNLGRWTPLFLDGIGGSALLGEFELGKSAAKDRRDEPEESQRRSDRGGKPRVGHAERARDLILQEILIIEPDGIVACGERVDAVLRTQLALDEEVAPASRRAWSSRGVPFLVVRHPSFRGRTEEGLRIVAEAAEKAGL